MSAESGQVVSFETFRQARERRTARVLPYLAPTQAGWSRASSVTDGVVDSVIDSVIDRVPESPFRSADLTRREIEHRQRMLDHLTRGSA